MKTRAGFFAIRSANDMLDKAKRDYQKLLSELDTDNILNFFVTCYHTLDYFEKEVPLSKTEIIAQMLHQTEWEYCDVLANTGKHLELTRNTTAKRIGPVNAAYRSDTLDGTWVIDGDSKLDGEPEYTLTIGDKQINILATAAKLIENWENLLGTRDKDANNASEAR